MKNTLMTAKSWPYETVTKWQSFRPSVEDRVTITQLLIAQDCYLHVRKSTVTGFKMLSMVNEMHFVLFCLFVFKNVIRVHFLIVNLFISCPFFHENRMDFIEITEEKLDISKISGMVTDPSCGAVSIFVGMSQCLLMEKEM